MYFKFLIAFLTFVCWVGVLPAQGLEVTVLDENNRPIFGCHVVLNAILPEGKPQAEITNVQGKASLQTAFPVAIKISHLGYLTEIDTIYQSGSYTYQLAPNAHLLGEFQITGQPVPVRIEESVYKVRVIDRERIEAQGAQNLRDLFGQDLNIRVTQDAVLGSGMNMQGVGGENIKIMIDGVPVIGRLDGNIDLSQINLNQIARVEIVEGPMSVQYGTNALGGVINLITQKDQPHTLDGNANLYYESVGQYNASFSTGIRKNKTLVQVSGGRYFFAGISPNDSVPSRTKTWKPREQYMADLALSHRFGPMQLRYQGGLYRDLMQNKGRPEVPFFVTANDQYIETWRNTHTLFVQGMPVNGHHLDITTSFSHFRRTRETFRKDLVTLNEVPVSFNWDEFQLFMNRSVYTLMPDSAKWQLQTGLEWNTETGAGPRITDEFQIMHDLSGFMAFEYRPSRSITIKPGVRYGWNSRFDAIPVPSVHTRWIPAKNWEVRVSYARGFRAPSLKELFFEFVDVNHRIFGNPDLKTETSHNIQWQTQYTIPFTNNNKLQLSLGGFYNDINNQIRSVLTSVTADSVIYRNENISYFKSIGFRVQGQLQFNNLQFGAGFTYTGTENGLQASNNRMVFYPEAQSSIGYQFPRWRGRFQLFVKHTGTMPVLYSAVDPDTQNEVIMEGLIGSFSNMDISYSQSLWKNRLQIVLYGKNLLNVTDVRQTAPSGGAHSSGSSSLPTLWGRSFGVSLRYNFQIGL